MPTFVSVQQSIAERPLHAGLLAFGAVLLIATMLFSIDYVLRPESFPVRSMSFEGEFKHVDQEALAAAVANSVRGNFFLVDLDAVREHVRSVPWVYDATVQRRWPDSVHIRFHEQQIVARWGKTGWVNVQGDYVDLRGQAGPGGLPTLNGPDGTQARVLDHYHKLSELLAPAQLQIVVLSLTPRHAWNIALGNGLLLTLGRDEPEAKVARFANAYPQTLAARVGNINRVDLRYANGFSVEWVNRANAPRASEVVATGLNEG